MSQSPVLNHTCLRVKDPKVSVPFYEKHFGFTHRKTLFLNNTTLYILGLDGDAASKKDQNWSAQEGLLELKHDHGSESDPNFKVSNGNTDEAKGFGHICVSVDNIEASEKKLLADGVEFRKKLSEGRQKDIAFALDPDGYWIELIENGINKTEGKTDPASYRFNHTMVRIKDPVKSLDFYQNVLGFKLLSTSKFEDAKFTLYFLAYDNENVASGTSRGKRQGLLELTHNWGTESDPSFKGYTNGNTTENGIAPGYGHICISLKDPSELVTKIENWLLKYGLIGPIGFFTDPDGYEIELLSHETFLGSQDQKLNA